MAIERGSQQKTAPAFVRQVEEKFQKDGIEALKRNAQGRLWRLNFIPRKTPFSSQSFR